MAEWRTLAPNFAAVFPGVRIAGASLATFDENALEKFWLDQRLPLFFLLQVIDVALYNRQTVCEQIGAMMLVRQYNSLYDVVCGNGGYDCVLASGLEFIQDVLFGEGEKIKRDRRHIVGDLAGVEELKNPTEKISGDIGHCYLVRPTLDHAGLEKAPKVRRPGYKHDLVTLDLLVALEGNSDVCAIGLVQQRQKIPA